MWLLAPVWEHVVIEHFFYGSRFCQTALGWRVETPEGFDDIVMTV